MISFSTKNTPVMILTIHFRYYQSMVSAGLTLNRSRFCMAATVPEKQQELLRFLEDSARFFGCQFIIATHSPFLLSMPQAKIYDLDEEIVDVKKWYELENVKAYYDFFKKHEQEFTEGKN